MGMTAPHQHEIVANFAACGHHDVVTERIMAVLLVLSVGFAGCSKEQTNLSQDPGFAEYFAKFPPASTPAGPAQQSLLHRHRPRFLLPPDHPGMIDFYLDYVPEGHLTDGSGRRVTGPLDRLKLNAHKGDPHAVFVHEPSGRPGTPTVYGRVDQEDVRFETEGGPVVEPFTFLTYHAVFRHSGLPAGMLAWQEWLIRRVASPDDWHQLDHYTAAILALDRGGKPVAVILHQHNHMRTYLVGRHIILPADGRMVLDVAIRSNELYPHQPGRVPHRVMGTPGASSLRYLISGEKRLLLGADDITEGRAETDYRLQFLPPNDAFYVFRGYLGERRRIPGRSGPPGAFYNMPSALKPRGLQLTAFYWREGEAGDLERLDRVLARDRGLVEFARAQSPIFHRDWRRISPAPRND
jgi:hypothetical protein